MEPQKYFPNLRGLVDARLEQELSLFVQRIYDYYDDKIKKIESNATSSAISSVRKQLDLFAANLAVPLSDASGDKLATVAEDKVIEVSDVPNLPTSKITSGALPLARLDIKIVKTDDAFTITPGAVPVGGKVTLKDNNGNSVDVLTP